MRAAATSASANAIADWDEIAVRIINQFNSTVAMMQPLN
jgi:hypothetical protein